MKLLAFDTSTEACSAALLFDGVVLSRYELAPRRHAELILPMIDEVLHEAGVTLTQLDAIAFGRGPGAFTGVRIATGIAQGLAFSTGVPLIAVSSLAALAQEVKDKADYLLAAIDARMGEIYYGCYRRAGDVVQLVDKEAVCKPANFAIAVDADCYGVGSGWINYAEVLSDKLGGRLQGFLADCYPDARQMLVLASHDYKQGKLLQPGEASPVYLRDRVTG